MTALGDEPSRLAAAATRLTTPCGSGQMVWRLWGEGRPLLLLHGDFGSWTHWLRCIPRLARRFRVIAPDMPGYGESTPPPEPWSPATLAAILATGLALAAPRDRLFVAGFSFGGIVGTWLAAELAARIDRLVLLGPGGFGLPASPLPPLRRLPAGADEAEARAVHRHNLAALMFADPAKVDDCAVDLQMANIRQARIRAGDIPQSDSLLQALPRTRARVSGIWGACDVMAQPVSAPAAALHRHQPDLDFRVLPGVGHWSPYEAPDAVVAALEEMLAVSGPS